MTRGNFFKSIAVLFTAPKILTEIELPKLAAKNIARNTANSNLICDLQLMMPRCYKQYVEKYSDENYNMWLEQLGEIKND